MNKIKLAYPVIVEGKYDKIKLSNIVDGTIIVTDGFGLFKDEDKKQLLRQIAEKSKVIVLTDSDGGGQIIRSHLSQILKKDQIIELYIPEIEGKEKRKDTPSKSGKLGVEGMKDELLFNLLSPFAEDKTETTNPLSKTDFFIDGLLGGENSRQKRDEIADKFGLPHGLNSNNLLSTLKVIATYEEYLSAVGRNK